MDPSGENIGAVSMPTSDVRRLASPPLRSTIHRSPPYVNAIWVRLTVGFLSSRWLLGGCCAAATHNTAAQAATSTQTAMNVLFMKTPL